MLGLIIDMLPWDDVACFRLANKAFLAVPLTTYPFLEHLAARPEMLTSVWAYSELAVTRPQLLWVRPFVWRLALYAC